MEINHIRPADQRGVNVFEATKAEQVPFGGFALSFGGAFVQEFQGLDHPQQRERRSVAQQRERKSSSSAIGHGFNNAVANLNINAQIAPGIRVAMTSYLSARHHQETWVKDGYLLVDNSPIDYPLLNQIMKYTTLRVGHFEINYGDSHFRRSDNGNSMFNPFVGNYILDDFTTEIRRSRTSRPMSVDHDDWRDGWRSARTGHCAGEAFRFGVLRQVRLRPEVRANTGRIRLTGSFYANNGSASNTLFTGDRGGSPYYDVLENTASTETANAWSGRVRPRLLEQGELRR